MKRLGNIRLVLPDSSQIGRRCYQALLACIWCYQPVSVILKLFAGVPVLGTFFDYVLPSVMVFLLAMSLEYILKQVRPVDVVFGIVAGMTVFITALVVPKNAPFIEEQLVQVLLISVPMYYIGLALRYEENRKLLYWAAVMDIAVSLSYRLYLLSQGQILMVNSMSASYKVLPSVMYLLLWSVRHGGLFNWIMALLGCVLTLLCGTRGPVVVIAVFVIVELFIKIAQMRNSGKKLFLIIMCILVPIIMLIDGAWLALMESLSELFEELGFSTRIFNYLISGEFSVSNARGVLADAVKEAIGENPIFGYGLMGDRVITEGHYVHNIFLEFLCHYGVFIGTGLLVAVYLIPATAIFRSRGKNCFHFLLMLACMVLIKLMLSSSYLLESDFFLMLGISVQTLRESKNAK